jgi:hypothetical protein
MKNEFIPYESALELKEFGFDEPCIMKIWWLNSIHKDTKIPFEPHITINKNDIDFEYPTPKQHPIDGFNALELYVPTFSQAFRWFRDKHNIDAWVQPFMMEKNGTPFLPDESYSYWIFKDGVLVADEVDFLNPEEAELACLEKLIEIVKTNTK